MSRILCEKCQRPEGACICQFFSTIKNSVQVIILQHPKEIGHSKGTVDLLKHSLTQCQVLIGEDFSMNASLNQLLAQEKHDIYLLYPNERSIDLFSKEHQTLDIKYDQQSILILIDATWKKAYKMYQLSKNLHQLTHLSLPDKIQGQYEIRKTSKKAALSTLEACVYALEIMEDSPKKYNDMIENFIKFNRFQLSFSEKN